MAPDGEYVSGIPAARIPDVRSWLACREEGPVLRPKSCRIGLSDL